MEIGKLSRVPSRGELFLLDYYAINDRIYCNVARSASMRGGVGARFPATIDLPPYLPPRLISTMRKQERFDRTYSFFRLEETLLRNVRTHPD